MKMQHSTTVHRQQNLLVSIAACLTLISGSGQSESIAAEGWQADPKVIVRLTRSYARQHGSVLLNESEVPAYSLPAVLSGSTDEVSNWNARREELLDLFQQHIYGYLPETPAAVSSRTVSTTWLGADAVKKVIEVSVPVGEAEFTFPFTLYAPRNGPTPVFVMIYNRKAELIATAEDGSNGFLPVPLLLERGYAVAVFQHADLAPDNGGAFREGILRHVLPEGPREPSACGAIGAWAWGASRVLDALEDEPLVDAKRAAVIGHSRGGKTALWAGATDTRFGLVISNNSGCMGAALSRRTYGETVEHITRNFPYWFCPRLAEYADNEASLPVDQHQLIALSAPRTVHIGSADEDLWADPRGEWLGLINAAPAFSLYRMNCLDTEDAMPDAGSSIFRGRTAYHIRAGRHNLTEHDWRQYVDTADRLWR